MAETKTTPFSTDVLSPEELGAILQRIDENLELRPLLLAVGDPADHAADDAAFVPLPDLGEVPDRLHTVRAFNAPYFLAGESGLRGFMKRLLNLPLKLFGFKQALFNHHALDVLERLTLQAQALRLREEQRAARDREVRRWRQTVNERFEQLIGAVEPFSGVSRLQATREILERQQRQLEGLREDAAARTTEIEELRGRVVALAESDDARLTEAALDRLQESQQGLHQWLESVVRTQEMLASQIQGHSAWIQQVVDTNENLAKQIQGHGAWIQQAVDGQQGLAKQLHGHTDWIELVQREVHAFGLASRRGHDTPGASATAVAPRIPDPNRYEALTSAMPDGLRVNLGCGIHPKEGWINVDFRALPYVEVVADVRKMPFEPGSVAALEAAHVVEHFRQDEMASQILPYWRSLLKPGGTLRIVCPNLHAIVSRCASGQLTLEDARALIFGGQEYVGNDHFAMYWPEALQALVAGAGFTRSEVIATERMNGLCPEVEVLAYS